MLENMEGQFGQRLRGVVELAAEEVGQNEEDRILISTIYKYSFLMEDVVVTLRNDLGKEEFVVGNPENIKQLSELINSEIQALLQVGIDLRRYPSGGVDKTVLSYSSHDDDELSDSRGERDKPDAVYH